MHTRVWRATALLALLVVLGVPSVACTSARAGRGAATATRPAPPEVTLEAELHHEGLIVLRSPTFR